MGLIGPNGAGKTTLFNVIYGLKPTAGRIRFKGEDITGLPPHQICRRGIARTFQLTRPFAELSVQDNVAAAVLFGRHHGRVTGLGDARSAADRILRSVKLEQRKETSAKDLLFSERRRLELARALATGPRKKVGQFLGTVWAPAVSLAILFLVLVFKPTGFFGKGVY